MLPYFTLSGLGLTVLFDDIGLYPMLVYVALSGLTIIPFI
ncbi:hypothetical protein QE422_003707 [Chryseobacterium sp. SORGH_AS 447]|nr:hypothetical protein [Chryseobacterium sp. SORGH_AS_0447]